MLIVFSFFVFIFTKELFVVKKKLCDLSSSSSCTSSFPFSIPTLLYIKFCKYYRAVHSGVGKFCIYMSSFAVSVNIVSYMFVKVFVSLAKSHRSGVVNFFASV